MNQPSDFADKYRGVTELKEIAQAIRDLTEIYTKHKQLSALAWHELEYLKKTYAPELMGEKTLIKWEGFPYRIQKKSDMYTGQMGGKAAEIKDWLFENGGEALIKETINSSSLKAFLKKRIEAGKPVPLELFKIEPFEVATVVKV